MTPVIRADLFMRAQGYNLQVILHQDNKSSISLVKMHFYKWVSVPDTLILVIFITDQYHKGEIEIQNTSTYDKIADYFTKTLQGEIP